jgi:PKD repeat protein
MPGIYSITLTVTNSSGSSTFTKSVLVKDLSLTEEPVPIIYYPFNGDTKNKAKDALNAISESAVLTTGANGIADAAYRFPSSASYIYTPDETALNFQNKIAISFWVKPDALPNNEQFIVSHGSWEERYKISIIPTRKVRWTVKTNQTVIDVDADSILQIGKFDHFTAIYTGNSLELYRNGKLSAFKALSGLIQTTSKSLTIARKDEGTSDYSFKGTVDEVRIYDTDLPQSIIHLLPTTFKLKAGINDTIVTIFKVYPNPFSTQIHISLPVSETLSGIEVFDLAGKKMFQTINSNTDFQINIPNGFYFLKVSTNSGKVYKTKIIKN